MNKTYNNVIDTLKSIGDKHLMIKKVESGDLWDMDLEKNTKYPLMFINPESVSANTNTLLYTFQIFICDLVMVDDSNEQEILSDTLQIALDIITLIKVDIFDLNFRIKTYWFDLSKSNVIFIYGNFILYFRSNIRLL